MNRKIFNIDNINIWTNIKLWIGIFIFSLFMVGSTYAYYMVSDIVSGVTGDAGEINFDLDVDKILPNTDKVDDVLVTNFSELASGLNSGCVDEEFALCQLYKVTLTNNSRDVNTKVSGKISFNNQNTPNLSWMLVDNYSASTNYTAAILGDDYHRSDPSFVKFENSRLLDYGTSVDYYILLWVNDAEGVQDDDGSYSGTIRFEDANGNGTTAEFGG